MKLHWSPRSPFVRKVLIVAHETGLADRINCVRSVALRTRVNPEILKDSPVGRIPVLVLDSGFVLSGSWLICEYLDSLHTMQKLIPTQGAERWRQFELHGVADGLLDTLVRWRGEKNRPFDKQLHEIDEACGDKTNACLNWLEKRASSLASEDFQIGHITTGVALDYLDFRFASLDWRQDRHVLADWHHEFLRRPSTMAAAMHHDE